MRTPTLAVLVLLLLAGCKSSEPEATKADFSKRPMPAGFHGPSGAPPEAAPRP